LRNESQEALTLYQVHLTEAQRDELQQHTRDPGLKRRTRDRLEMVRLADAGWSVPRIAAHLRLGEQNVRHWIKCYLDGGFAALPDQPHRGRPSRLPPKLTAALHAVVEQGERTWTAEQMAEWLEEEHGVQLTPPHVAKRLKKVRLSYKRTERGVKHKQDPEEGAQKQADLETAEKGELTVAWTSAT
jgi:transposase